MTSWAMPGEAREDWPEGIGLSERQRVMIPGQTVLTWKCPTCDLVTAATCLDPGDPAATAPIGYRPVPYPNGSREGLPLYGPSRRDVRGKATRRGEARREAAAADLEYRRGPRTPVDILRMLDAPNGEPATEPLNVIRDPRFEVICHNCFERVGIDVTG